MGQLSAPSPFPRRAPKPWPRSCQRRWARPNQLASAVHLLTTIPSLPRPLLARITTRMIDRMDEIDGDADLENLREDDEPEDDMDLSGDDGCGPIALNGRHYWGSQDDDPGKSIPVYGVDQTKGTVGRKAAESHQRPQENYHD